jgi:hypothetical protein
MSRWRRSAKKSAPGRPARRRPRKPAAGAVTRASPALSAAIRALIAARRIARRPTLGAARAALQKSGVSWSGEGELLFPQDRTALLIELDELIDARGTRARATDFLSLAARRP